MGFWTGVAVYGTGWFIFNFLVSLIMLYVKEWRTKTGVFASFKKED
jgi:hypothetical protein